MKKFKFLLTFCLAIILVFTACQLHPNFPVQQRDREGVADREYLALLKAEGNYVVSSEMLEYMVASFINPIERGAERSVVSSEKAKITGSSKLTVINEKRHASMNYGRSAEDSIEPEPVDVYAFTITKPGSENPGYVLASDDLRVGIFLGMADEGSLDDEGLSGFYEILFEGIGNYVNCIVEEYESITEGEVEDAVARSAARSAARSTSVIQTASGSDGFSTESDNANKADGYYKHFEPSLIGVVGHIVVSYFWFNGYYAILPTEWRQLIPYDHVVTNLWNAKNGTNIFYSAGCVPVAIGQIMAFHKKPVSSTFTQNNLDRPTYNYTAGNGRTYNWNEMISTPKKTSIGDPGALDIAELMYEIGERVNATYNADKTGAWTHDFTDKDPDARDAFKDMGYTLNYNFMDYNTTNYPILKSSIQAGRPVLVSGYSDKGGHAWVIDAVRVMGYFEDLYDTNGNYLWQISGPFISRESMFYDWVHCNLGWANTKNAWYPSGVFQCYSGFQARARSTILTSDHYRYLLEFLPHIY